MSDPAVTHKMIGLVDVDGHNFPNIPLMKISAWHKSHGDTVQWWSADSPHYDIVYMSKVFSDAYTPDIAPPSNADMVVKGGSGYAIETVDGREVYHREKDPPLEPEIEAIYPDYSIYARFTGYGEPMKKQTAYGFLTRGCPRGCAFCHVAPKEGRCSKKVSDLDQFWRGQGNICLSDPNILACSDAPELLRQLVKTGAKIDFNQGLDARLVTEETAELLASMNLKTPHFAMDSMESVDAVAKGLRRYVSAVRRTKGRWNWRDCKVFCLTNFDTTHLEDMQRIKTIQECECWPFVMIYNKPSAPTITRRLQRWTNNAIAYASLPTFTAFQRAMYKTVIYSA